MTFKELNKKLGGNEKRTDWRQHPNGLGWLHKSAKVDSTAQIGPDAIVWGTVSGNARVYGIAWVYGHAQVYDDAQVYDGAQVYDDAQIYGHARVKSPLFVVGSRNCLSQ